ncbi:MAG: histidinol-phosphate aminotransferase family protein [Chloroflexi bacterium]|nr:histidinol-phosphate aminotransferase family protein [Chloroflexota bacterium]
MSIRPRPEVERVPPVIHGGFHSEHATDWLDFSSNVNPFGPSPRIWDAMRAVPIGQHPDPRAAPLREVLAEIENVSPCRLIVGNGSVELIYHLAVAYLRAGDRVLVVGPTFGEYAAACAIMGAQVMFYRTRPANDFEINLDALLSEARACKPRLIFLCNPNNPTGIYLPREVIETILRGRPDALLVLDQAFVHFVADAWNSRPLLAFDNLLILRSLTKDYALTALRVGYATGSSSVIEAIEKVQPPWSVNTLAQVATIAALRDEKHLRDSLAALAHAKDAFIRALTQLDLRVVPSATNFFLLQVPSASELARQLRERKLVVRDCTSFGLPTFARIAVRKPEENVRLVSVLGEL